MGGGGSKPENAGVAPSQDKDVVKIQNLTEQEVVIREKNRQVHGPIRYELAVNEVKRVPRPPPGGTYMRHAVLVKDVEIGVISNEDLEKKQGFTIRRNARGKYEIISEERAEPSRTEESGTANV